MSTRAKFIQKEYKYLKSNPDKVIIGIDEAGRGSWAGPLSIAAVAFSQNLKKIKGLADSKLLNHSSRLDLYKKIQTTTNYWHIFICHQQIDIQGLSKCLKEGIEKLAKLAKADYILFDGNCTFKAKTSCPIETVIKGDQKLITVAAASIIAKVERDLELKKQANSYPQYEFQNHFGYGTRKHRQLLEEHGPCNIHRHSFEPIKSLIQSM